MINRNKKAKNNETFENRSWVNENVFNGLAKLSLINQRRFNIKLLQRCSFIFLATVFLIASAWIAEAAVFPGPDEFGYTGVELSGDDVGLRDIRSSGNPVSLGDDEMSVPLPIGFKEIGQGEEIEGYVFEYYGTPYDSFQISSNGYISFTGIDDPYLTAQPIPHNNSPDNFIAGYWAHLNPSDWGGVVEKFIMKRLDRNPTES